MRIELNQLRDVKSVVTLWDAKNKEVRKLCHAHAGNKEDVALG